MPKPVDENESKGALLGSSVTPGSDCMLEPGAGNTPMKDRNLKKMTKLALSNSSHEEAKVFETLPEVRAKAPGKSKGRMVPSRYMESAKSRAVAKSAKMSDSSCISVNESKLFSTATSSTPVAAGGKVQDITVRPKKPPKMAPLDSKIRQRPSAGATASASGKETDKTALKIKKCDKTATIKVKPLRAEPTKNPARGHRNRASEHQLLYNQYLQWTYLCRMSQASICREQPRFSLQARQLGSLVYTARQDCTDLERKLQAVKLHREMVQLEQRLGGALSAINDSADTVRDDLLRLATALEATRSRLRLNGCLEPSDAEAFVEELVAAAERCRQALSALYDTVSPHANLLQHTAEAVGSLQQALRHSSQHMTGSSEMLQKLSSLALQEASLSLSAVPPAPTIDDSAVRSGPN